MLPAEICLAKQLYRKEQIRGECVLMRGGAGAGISFRAVGTRTFENIGRDGSAKRCAVRPECLAIDGIHAKGQQPANSLL
jgi:hypothetical protein